MTCLLKLRLAEIAELAGPPLIATALALGLIWLPATGVNALGLWLLCSFPAGMLIGRLCALTNEQQRLR